jgi:beta-glucosidase
LPPPSKEIPVRKLPPLAAATVALVTAAAFAVHALAATADAPTPRERARALVAQMTLDEKIAQLHGIRTSTEFRTVPAIPRLGIPKLLLTNGPAGVSTGGITQPSATALPAPISLAASWDLRQADAYGDIEGAETLSVGRNVLEGPTVNIARVPVNGRTFEGYGEDPYLAARFAVRNIQAIQAHGVIANVKHYFGNNQEANRFSINDDIAERTMREIYLPAFEASVKEAKVGSVMCAYPKINGTFNCENRLVLTTILKREWGFDGFVFSDFGAVHSTVGSANAGLDLETPTGKFFNSTALQTALQNGQVTMATIDDKLVRRYTKMIELGLFDRTPTITPIPAAEHGRVARKLGAEGLVLLKNANVGGAPVLPLSRASLRSIALIGNDTAKTGGGGSSHVKPLYTVTPSAGLRSRAGSGVTVTVTSGADPTAAAAAAQAATVAIVMVEDSESEGHDRTSLALSGNQDALVSAVVAANPRTVVVAKTGGPILMPWASRVPAILQAWYPGEEDGNAVADVLFGAFNPSGKLPITFPRRETDVPANTTAQYPGIDGTAHYSEGIFVGYRHYDARSIAPLFPFGHGLSYSTYAYSNLKITQGTSANVTVEADVTNTGSRTGAEIVQLYVGSPATAAAPEAPKELQGFQKILLTPGQTGHVSFTLNARSFSFWSTATHRWRIAGGQYRIQLGSSSRDLRLTGSVSLSAA